MSDFVYGLALLFRLVPPVVGGDLESSPMKSAHNSNNPELIEAERRRALALRALEERLQQQHQNSPQLSRQGPDAVPNNNNTAVV
jgi:hypothetical protein